MPVRGHRSVVAVGVVVLLAAMAGLSLSPPLSPRTSAQDTVMVLDPGSAQVDSDGILDVDVVISNASNLYSASFHLSFDPSILEVVDADLDHSGVQIFPGNFPGPWDQPGTVQANQAENGPGTIDYDFTLVDGATSVSGGGTLARIRFHAIGTGTSALTFDTANLWGPTPGVPIAVTTLDGSVTVADAPTPTAADTPQATATAADPATATDTPAATNTPTATRTATATRTPADTATPRPTATPRGSVTPKPPKSSPQATTPAAGAAGAQTTPSSGLPHAGTGDMPSQIWRWFFLSGAVILGLATWAFTFRFYARQKESERFWHR
ncbi:MAG: cohesin domain-containing protein [Dehalococcoidia bacterium]